MLAIFGLVALVWKVVPVLKEKWIARWTRKHLPHTFGAQLYAAQEIDRATRYYVEPDCQSIDPSGGEEFRQVFAARDLLRRARFFPVRSARRGGLRAGLRQRGKGSFVFIFVPRVFTRG